MLSYGWGVCFVGAMVVTFAFENDRPNRDIRSPTACDPVSNQIYFPDPGGYLVCCLMGGVRVEAMLVTFAFEDNRPNRDIRSPTACNPVSIHIHLMKNTRGQPKTTTHLNHISHCKATSVQGLTLKTKVRIATSGLPPPPIPYRIGFILPIRTNPGVPPPFSLLWVGCALRRGHVGEVCLGKECSNRNIQPLTACNRIREGI